MYGKIKNVPNHQPASVTIPGRFRGGALIPGFWTVGPLDQLPLIPPEPEKDFFQLSFHINPPGNHKNELDELETLDEDKWIYEPIVQHYLHQSSLNQ